MTKRVAYDTLEQLQAAAERKRKMADALASQSMQREQITSPFQVLGKLAEALAARNLGRQSGELSADYKQQVQDRTTREINEFLGLPESVTPQQRMAYAMSRQHLPQAFKDQATKMATPDMENIQGTWVDKNSVKPGDYAANDPSADVLRGADGSLHVNQAKLQQHLAQATGRTAPITLAPQQDPMTAPPAQVGPPERAVQMLRQNPETAAAFAEKYKVDPSQFLQATAPQAPAPQVPHQNGAFTDQMYRDLVRTKGPQAALKYVQDNNILVGR